MWLDHAMSSKSQTDLRICTLLLYVNQHDAMMNSRDVLNQIKATPVKSSVQTGSQVVKQQ